MSIKHKIKFKSYRDRGPSPAELRSSVPKHSAERPASKLGVEGESIRRDVPDNDNEYRSGGAYRAILKIFAQHRAESGETSTPVSSPDVKTNKRKKNE